MSRGKARLLAVGMLSMTLLLGSLVPVQAGTALPIFQDALLGVGLSSLPQDTRVVRDRYLSPAYGFTVVDGEGRLLARVEWLHEASPAEMNGIALKLRESFPTISMRRSSVAIDGRKAIMLSPVPGQVETAVAFVSANGRLYRIFYNTESNLGLNIVRSLTFIPPQGALSVLGLRQAQDALYDSPLWDWQIDPKKPTAESLTSESLRQGPHPQPQVYTPSGCVDFPT